MVALVTSFRYQLISGCLSLFLLLFFAGCLLIPNRAEACGDARLEGLWLNQQAAINDIKLIEIRYSCKNIDPVTNLPVILMLVESLCQPRNCSWGIELAEHDDEGKLFAVFNKFTASHVVNVNVAGDNKLAVSHVAEYRSSDKPTKRADIIFVRP